MKFDSKKEAELKLLREIKDFRQWTEKLHPITFWFLRLYIARRLGELEAKTHSLGLTTS